MATTPTKKKNAKRSPNVPRPSRSPDKYVSMVIDRARLSTFITPQVECSQSLILGEAIDPADESLPFKYAYTNDGELFDFFPADALMSIRLADALAALGVDNHQRFEAELTDTRSGKTRLDYVVVNIVGLATPKKSGGLRLFRSSKSWSEILVTEGVAKALEAGNFRGLRFIAPV